MLRRATSPAEPLTNAAGVWAHRASGPVRRTRTHTDTGAMIRGRCESTCGDNKEAIGGEAIQSARSPLNFAEPFRWDSPKRVGGLRVLHYVTSDPPAINIG